MFVFLDPITLPDPLTEKKFLFAFIRPGVAMLELLS